MYGKFQKQLQEELQSIQDAGLFKKERIIINPQAADIRVSTGEDVLNFVLIITWGFLHTLK